MNTCLRTILFFITILIHPAFSASYRISDILNQNLPPKTERTCVVFDIDDTLCHQMDRSKIDRTPAGHVILKNWIETGCAIINTVKTQHHPDR